MCYFNKVGEKTKPTDSERQQRVRHAARLVENLSRVLGLTQYHRNWVWWCLPAFPVLGMGKQENQTLKVILGYMGYLVPAWAT